MTLLILQAMAELDDGKTLARVIELSIATLVVLDKERVAPFSRLWCLYEIGSTPTSKFQLLTHGFGENDIAQHVRLAGFLWLCELFLVLVRHPSPASTNQSPVIDCRS